MKTLNRNRRTFYYSLYQGTRVELTDEEGNYTGEYAPAYSEPVECKGYISAATGTADMEVFGQNVTYDKVIILAGIDTEITESTRLWIDVPTTDSYDYIVKRVAKSLNATQIAIQQVNTHA